jgi:hypothetical protein
VRLWAPPRRLPPESRLSLPKRCGISASR